MSRHPRSSCTLLTFPVAEDSGLCSFWGDRSFTSVRRVLVSIPKLILCRHQVVGAVRAQTGAGEPGRQLDAWAGS